MRFTQPSLCEMHARVHVYCRASLDHMVIFQMSWSYCEAEAIRAAISAFEELALLATELAETLTWEMVLMLMADKLDGKAAIEERLWWWMEQDNSGPVRPLTPMKLYCKRKELLMFYIYLSRDIIKSRFNISLLCFLYLLYKLFSIEKKLIFLHPFKIELHVKK